MKKLFLIVALVASFTLVSCESQEEKVERLQKEYLELQQAGKTEEAAAKYKEYEEAVQEMLKDLPSAEDMFNN